MRLLLGVLLSLFTTASLADSDTDLVSGIVSNTFITVMDELQTATTEEDAKRIISVHFLDMLDLPITARIVVGKYWRKATPEQRQGFVDAFQVMMIRSYSRFLLGDEAKQVNMEIVRSTPKGKKGDRIQVSSTLTMGDGRVVAVEYMFRFNKEKDKWLVIDLTVEGISIAFSYRSSYQRIIKEHGMDSLISRMEAKNVSVASGE